MIDRGQQALHLLALDPVVKTSADRNSYVRRDWTVLFGTEKSQRAFGKSQPDRLHRMVELWDVGSARYLQQFAHAAVMTVTAFSKGGYRGDLWGVAVLVIIGVTLIVLAPAKESVERLSAADV